MWGSCIYVAYVLQKHPGFQLWPSFRAPFFPMTAPGTIHFWAMLAYSISSLGIACAEDPALWGASGPQVGDPLCPLSHGVFGISIKPCSPQKKNHFNRFNPGLVETLETLSSTLLNLPKDQDFRIPLVFFIGIPLHHKLGLGTLGFPRQARHFVGEVFSHLPSRSKAENVSMAQLGYPKNCMERWEGSERNPPEIHLQDLQQFQQSDGATWEECRFRWSCMGSLRLPGKSWGQHVATKTPETSGGRTGESQTPNIK